MTRLPPSSLFEVLVVDAAVTPAAAALLLMTWLTPAPPDRRSSARERPAGLREPSSLFEVFDAELVVELLLLLLLLLLVQLLTFEVRDGRGMRLAVPKLGETSCRAASRSWSKDAGTSSPLDSSNLFCLEASLRATVV